MCVAAWLIFSRISRLFILTRQAEYEENLASHTPTNLPPRWEVCADISREAPVI
jgi:hypothetical protein